ncbi:MAG: yhgE [Firmicutes bacterium]|nr:yhgE [Bacillota bacterium]
MKHNVKKTIIRIVVVAAVIIIPLLYSYLYLGAFWDPYSRLEDLPVAVVNNDKGAMINDEERNVGEELWNKLQDSAELKFDLVDGETAKEGTEGHEYYAMIVIPENFSEDIASASTSNKETATITYSANEKRNYLASQILKSAITQVEESIQTSIDSEIVGQLADTINAVPDQMLQLQDGITKLQDGANQLQDGTTSLAEGTKTFHDKFLLYQQGVTDLKTGASKLAAGAGTLDSGLAELQQGAHQLTQKTENINQLAVGAQALAAGSSQLETGITQYRTGVDSLISSVNSTSAFLKQYVTSVNPSIMKDPVFAAFIAKMSNPDNAKNIEALQAAGATLTEASKQISEGSTQLSAGCQSLPQLKDALNKMSLGLDQVKAGSLQLTRGSKSLKDGLGTVDHATTQLAAATNDIMSGAEAVKDGTGELKDGIGTAKDGVAEAITDTNQRLDTLDGLAKYAEEPARIEAQPINAVPNYGTAFAPYFLSLSLWVGALIMFVGIYLDTEGKFKILTSASEHRLARSFIYLLIGFAQAIALALALQFSLGLNVTNPSMFYLACCLVSMVFISIVQFLMVHLKDLGKFLSIVILILQLTSCGGTFPMETIPKFFKVLYPYMPMTYSVGLFKDAISGKVTKDTVYNTTILIAILVVFMALTIVISAIKSRRVKKVEEKELIGA